MTQSATANNITDKPEHGHGHGSGDGGHSCGHKVCPRKIHSVAGMLFGVMMVQHFLLNMLTMWPTRFDAAVGRLHDMGILLPILSLVLVILPLGVHIVYGIRMLKSAGLKYNTGKHHRGSDFRHLLQRLSAVVLLLFIVFHLATIHRWGLHQVHRLTGWSMLERYADSGLFDASDAYASTAAAVGHFFSDSAPMAAGNLLISGLYLAAIWATAYHLGNGFATTAMVWHIPKTQAQEKKWSIAGGIFGLCIGIIGTMAWVGLMFH
ncbi:MAG: hypothetical protein ACF8OB_03505 [Phycisphaeraceae bacterium JB051]